MNNTIILAALLMLLASVCLWRQWISAPGFSWWFSCSACCGCIGLIQRGFKFLVFFIFLFFSTGTDHTGKSETEGKENGHTEGENGSLGEERKRKHDETPVNGEQKGEEIKHENHDATTDVNGNEGPDAKKRKLGYIENGHKNEMVRLQELSKL